ncbi:MAG: hypothetical protein ACRD2O_14230 [Terriglobia bacterium]
MKCRLCTAELKHERPGAPVTATELCEACAQTFAGETLAAFRIRKALFSLGQVVATPVALKALERSHQSPHEFLGRHVRGDWGELDEFDRRENEYSIVHGFRILSSYRTAAGEKLWLITERDRSSTTLLLPDEY